jgi:hypothetical protein
MIRAFVALAVLMVLSFLAVPSVAGVWSDVPTDHWDGWEEKLYTEELMFGFPDGTFKGNRSWTRYEAAAVFSRLIDKLLESRAEIDPTVAAVMESAATGPTEMSFVDIPQDHWAYDDVKNLENLGLVIGRKGDEFVGGRSLTRYEMAALVGRLAHQLNIKPDGEIGDVQFTDVPEDHWARHYIEELEAMGFIEGYPDGRFRGDRTFSRYEAGMVILRILDRLWSKYAEPSRPTEPN